jgi:hypothetical protein
MKTKEPGMYACNDPRYPQVHVEEFLICRQDDNSVWIQTDDGEGCQFSDELFGTFIRNFYKQHR